jgi:hypothetical protein
MFSSNEEKGSAGHTGKWDTETLGLRGRRGSTGVVE